eukprot:gene26672-biopygen17121
MSRAGCSQIETADPALLHTLRCPF